MTVPSGSHELGPDQGTLRVHTERGGAAAKAGHDLVLEVGSWRATLRLAEEVSASGAELEADSGSLRVIEASGGIQDLGDEDRANIEQTIDDEVLEGKPISFRSTGATETDAGLRLDGELTIGEATGPISFELSIEEGTLAARAVVKQSDWGVKPYSALFGALKVKDELAVTLDARL